MAGSTAEDGPGVVEGVVEGVTAVASWAVASLHRLAGDLRARGGEVDRVADEVVDAVHRTAWAGRAAEAAAARSRERGTALRRCADDHRRAAVAVEEHARAVAAVAALGGALVGSAVDAVDDVRDALADGLADGLVDGLGRLGRLGGDP